MFLKTKSFFRIGMWHSRPPPFMEKTILNFHFDYLTPSLIMVEVEHLFPEEVQPGGGLTAPENESVLDAASLITSRWAMKPISKENPKMKICLNYNNCKFYVMDLNERVFSLLSYHLTASVEKWGSKFCLSKFWDCVRYSEIRCWRRCLGEG